MAVVEVEAAESVVAMAYLVIRRKGTLDLSLAYVVLDNVIPADHRVHGPTAISGQIHGGLRVPLRQTSSHRLSEFGRVGEGNSIQEGAVLGSVFAGWRGRGGPRGVAGGVDGGVGAA